MPSRRLLIALGVTCAVSLPSAAATVGGTAPPVAVDVAASQERAAKARLLFEAEGAGALLDDTLAEAARRARTLAERIVRESTARIAPDAAQRVRLQAAADRFVADMMQGFPREDSIAVWQREYADRFSDAELDQLLAFYRSPLHAKEREISESARSLLVDDVNARYARRIAEPERTLTLTLRALIRDCHCERSAAAAPADARRQTGADAGLAGDAPPGR
jgi:hypothetical protein